MNSKKVKYLCGLFALWLLLGFAGCGSMQIQAAQKKQGENAMNTQKQKNVYKAASEELRQHGINLVNKTDFLTLNSVDADGFPQTRTVANLHKDRGIPFIKDGKYAFYFVTNRNSAKVQQFRENPKASAYYLDLPAATWVLYTGRIDEVKDPALAKMLWADWMTPMYGTWENPDYMVIRLVPETIKTYYKGQVETGSL